MAAPPTDTYLLRRDRVEALRLTSQHLLWQLHTNHLLHPAIPIKDDMAIADIGAGTGIWAVELATQLSSSSARIRAYDVADTHFPRKEYSPSNVTFDKMDSLSDPPSCMVGQFDVVHLRMWAFVIRDNDPSPLIRHAAKLLKPGGYLQWEDARFGNIVAKGAAALHMKQMMDILEGSTKLNFQWLDQLDQHVKNAGADLGVVDCQYKPWSAELIPLCTDTFLGAIENSGAILERLKKVVPSVPSPEEWNNGLETLHSEIRKPDGNEFYWLPVTLLARKYA